MELNPLLRGTELTDSCCLLFFVFWMDMFRHLGHLIMVSLRFIPKFVGTALQKIHGNSIWGHTNSIAAINNLLLSSS